MVVQDVEPTMPDGTVTVDNYFFATAAKDDTEVGTTEVTSVQSGTAVSAEAVDNGVETVRLGGCFSFKSSRCHCQSFSSHALLMF